LSALDSIQSNQQIENKFDKKNLNQDLRNSAAAGGAILKEALNPKSTTEGDATDIESQMKFVNNL